jgi:hypothetical protein
MKKQISIIAIMLFALIVNVKAQTNEKEAKQTTSTECVCCHDCKNDKCKELCKKFNELTGEAQKGEEGKKVKEECMSICKENKSSACSAHYEKAACEGKKKKACCKKK